MSQTVSEPVSRPVEPIIEESVSAIETVPETPETVPEASTGPVKYPGSVPPHGVVSETMREAMVWLSLNRNTDLSVRDAANAAKVTASTMGRAMQKMRNS